MKLTIVVWNWSDIYGWQHPVPPDFAGAAIFMRTRRHPLADWLSGAGVALATFDGLSGESAAQLLDGAAGRIRRELEQGGRAVYIVPTTLAGDQLAAALLHQPTDITIEHLGGAPDALALLDRQGEITVIDYLLLENYYPHSTSPLLIRHLENEGALAATIARLKFLYPAASRVSLFGGYHPSQQLLGSRELGELETPTGQAVTMLYVQPAATHTLGALLRVMQTLRSENGCPWDRRQTHRSLRPYLLEEAYEVIDAIEREDRAALMEELGDLLLQVVFHCQLARERGDFTLADVVHHLTDKLIRRHPHVFGDLVAGDAGEAIKRWDEIKKSEKGDNSGSVIRSIEQAMPALLRARKVQHRAAGVGFDWPEAAGALDKIREELAELENVYKSAHQDRIEEELGDLLFAVVNVSRFVRVDPEVALNRATKKFINRFQYIEKLLGSRGESIANHTLDFIDKLWKEAKNKGIN